MRKRGLKCTTCLAQVFFFKNDNFIHFEVSNSGETEDGDGAGKTVGVVEAGGAKTTKAKLTDADGKRCGRHRCG